MPHPSSDTAVLLEKLTERSAYPFEVDHVEVRQTHISVVFLAGEYAYKIKKPIKLPFLDFSTLEQRRHFCDEEVRINRRLAADVYLGVVPVCEEGDRVCFEGTGPVVDWAVKMQRLPDDATMAVRLQQEALSPDEVDRLAERLAEFHETAPRNGRAARFGSFNVVAQNMRDNLAAAEKQVGRTLTANVLARLRRTTEDALGELRELIESRVTAGFVRELHGDLHLDHVYLFPDRPPPGDVVIVDAIEFNEAFRWIDVVADMAFCVMDFTFHGRRDFARQFAETYFTRTNGVAGRRLLPLYSAYRAAVRAKVEGITASEAEVPLEQRTVAARHAQAHWLIALGELSAPAQRPALLLMSGLPGTGKSTVARDISEEANFRVIRSDVVRKELAVESRDINHQTTAAKFEEGIYTRDWTERTYAECCRLAECDLRDGGRVIVDATFLHDSFRQQFADLAKSFGVPVLWITCETSPQIARQRLAARQNDASDADWTIYQHAAATWEPPIASSRRMQRRLDTSGSPRDVERHALAILRNDGLA